MALNAKNTPDATSSDYDAMLPIWRKAETIMAGADAMRKAGGIQGNPYLPRFPNETTADYEYRRNNAKFTNIYGDILTNLAAKPFAEELQLVDGAPPRFRDLSEDIDGRGNNLHVFAASSFRDAINYGVDWILVDYTKPRPRRDGRPLSIAEERQQNLRPYWVSIPATRLIAVYTAMVRGREQVVHARVLEYAIRREEYLETFETRVRVFNREPVFEVLQDGTRTNVIVDYAPATYRVLQRVSSVRGRRSSSWETIDEGPISIGVIPLVPIITGTRDDGSWRIKPPLEDVADLQIEHFQQETALKSIKELTAFPTFAANGVSPPRDAAGNPVDVTVGPKSVLFAPPNPEGGAPGGWDIIEPSAESLRFLSEDIDKTEKQMREIGRQPLVASQMTVVQAGMNAQKANSAIQAWALGLKDALEQAWVFTAMWLGEEAQAPSVRVYNDFDAGLADDKGPTTLIEARKIGDLSQRTLWDEMRRRGILSPDFDPEVELERLTEEGPGDPTPTDQAAALGVDPAQAA